VNPYVTRAATLQYQQIIGGGYEACRRALTEQILQALNGNAERGVHYVVIVSDAGEMRAYMQPEGDLLIVNKIESSGRRGEDPPEPPQCGVCGEFHWPNQRHYVAEG
jgi:hypothetical protein